MPAHTRSAPCAPAGSRPIEGCREFTGRLRVFSTAPEPSETNAEALRARPSVPNPKSVTKFGGGSTTLAALLLLGIAPTIPRRRALPAPPIHPRLWQRTSGPGHYPVSGGVPAIPCAILSATA